VAPCFSEISFGVGLITEVLDDSYVRAYTPFISTRAQGGTPVNVSETQPASEESFRDLLSPNGYIEEMWKSGNTSLGK
jgi:hypothetical protein